MFAYRGVQVRVFQSTHPSGVRRELVDIMRTMQIFQSTHPSGVRLGTPSQRTVDCRFQSTHPSGVRRDRCSRRHHRRPISIHAPQWGATELFRWGFIVWGISIHAPQWGATVCSPPCHGHRPYFNPRTPVGCDVHSEQVGHRPMISIHAPQWGATPNSPTVRASPRSFQSTHPSGVRHGMISAIVIPR